MELQLWKSCQTGSVVTARQLLRTHPGINVNWQNFADEDLSSSFPLLVACQEDHPGIVSLLLAHPAIEVNKQDGYNFTPFVMACLSGSTSCVKLLLQDSRVNLNLPGVDGFTALWQAAANAHVDVVKWWIASGREMDLGQPGVWTIDAIGVAKRNPNSANEQEQEQEEQEEEEEEEEEEERARSAEMISFLERFRDNPDDTRWQVRLELGYYDVLAAEVLAPIVFLCDGLVRIREHRSQEDAARFLMIASKVPLELQMVLCHRRVGFGKDTVGARQMEEAFKALAEFYS